MARKKGKVRYAVVGLGWFAQQAILPAFAKVKNAEVVALVSGDDTKLEELAQRYGARHAIKYRDYDELLSGGRIDAVYIALPNTMPCDFAARAAHAGVHVLCQKPMAMDEAECGRLPAAKACTSASRSSAVTTGTSARASARAFPSSWSAPTPSASPPR